MLRLFIAIIAIVIVSMLTSCTSRPQPRLAQETPPPSTTTPQPRVDTESVLLWASEEPSVVVVNKACQTLNVYQYGRLTDRKSTRLNSSHIQKSRMPSSA